MNNKNQAFIQIPTELVLTREVSPRAVLVYGILLNQKSIGGNALPYEAIASMLNTSMITVRNCVKELQREGFIRIEKQGRNNEYYFNE